MGPCSEELCLSSEVGSLTISPWQLQARSLPPPLPPHPPHPTPPRSQAQLTARLLILIKTFTSRSHEVTKLTCPI